MEHRVGRWADLFLMVAVLFGSLVRFAPTVLAHSVINDGGMFYTMLGEIRDNHFLLPAFTSYNQLNIPFTYPPLSLYVGALLASLGIPAMDVVRWLPPLISSLSILAFYWMACQMLASRNKASLAAVAYALMPRTFSWYVMGGGLSRSFGVLFLLLTCGSAWLLFEKTSWRRIALTGIFGAAAVLSHPETAIHTVAACALIGLFRGRNRIGLRDALLVAAGVLLLTAPWWGTVLAQHGLDPVRSALSTGGHSGFFWVSWLTMDFAEERFVTLLTVLGLIGFALQIIRRQWFLPVWMLLPFAVEPRSATAIAALPLALLAAVGLADLVIPRIASLASPLPTDGSDWTTYMSAHRAVRVVVGYVIFLAMLGSFAYDLSLSNYVVSPQSRAAMAWVAANAPEGSKFIVLTGQPDPFADPAQEWFPALTQRTSENTIQGREWTLGPRFTPFLNGLPGLTACMNHEPACVQEWATANQVQYDYILIEKARDKAGAPPTLLPYALRRDWSYSVAFENDGVVIFRTK